MSASWTNNPNTPQIPYQVYLVEKGHSVGIFINAIACGIATVLFLQCMGTLLRPANYTRGAVKWGLVVHTVAVFLLLTAQLVIDLNNQCVSYVNNREFPGDEERPPGPAGYNSLPGSKAIPLAYSTLFPLTQWLTDGLLLHRCYVIYSRNYWAVALPFLMYLASIAVGIADIYQYASPGSISTFIELGTSYNSIFLALNVLLTAMIVARLILHRRKVRNAIGASGGLYTTLITVLVESYAGYAVALLLYIVPWALNSWVTFIFAKFICPIQVIALYLITLRVASRRALTSSAVVCGSGSAEAIRFASRGTVDGEQVLSTLDFTSSVES